MSGTKFLLIVMDGLRPDLVTRELMPCLAEFRDSWAWFANARAAYPSVTRVNNVSLATGAHPGEHGIWYNNFYDPTVYPDREIDLSVMSDVFQADGIYGKLIEVPTIGQYLADAGRRYALIHTATAGAAWLLDYRGDRLGHAHYSFAGAYACTPDWLHGVVEKVLGPQPQPQYPNLPQLEYAFDVFQEVVRPRVAPDVTVMWLMEPDKSLHRDGIHGPVAVSALRGLDALFGRIHDWWQQHNGKGEEDWQLIVLSDHGHSVRHRRVDVLGRLQAAGFDITENPAGRRAYLSGGSPCGVYWRNGSEAGAAELVRWLQGQEWIGHIFTRNDHPVEGRYPGTLSHAVVGLSNRRVPDVLFSPRGDDAPDSAGYPGRFLMRGSEGERPHGSGHGGLTESEMRTVLIAGGSAFEPRRRIETPASISDVLPTILSVYGRESVAAASGRVLGEALRRGPRRSPASVEQTHEAGDGRDYRQTVRVAMVCRRRYVLQGGTGLLDGA